MADAVLSFVVERIGDLLLQEARFLSGVSDQVEQLQAELNRMRCFLKDADARQDESDSLRNWIAEIREAAYDAEDLIETFVLKVASSRRGGFINNLKRFPFILDEFITRHEVRSEIDKIKSKISRIGTSLQTYGIKEVKEREEWSGSSHEKVRERRRPFPHVVEENIVGVEDSVDELVNALIDEEKHFRVMSICGMGGLGKTTLAKKIYHHTQISHHFDRLAWVYVSQQCQRRDIWQGILSGLTSGADADRIMKLRDEQLAEELHQFLQNKKCMVIVDDIWSTEAWDSLKAAFPNRTKSRVLLTTRKKDLLLYADPKGFLYEPKCLSDEDSWELFHKIAFSRLEHTYSEIKIDVRMEELGKQMVGHCAGLPLAIRVLGGILATKHTLKQWQIVHESIKRYITKGIGYGEHHSAVSDVLSLSYDDLLPHLKQCFLYLSHFPEDYDIPVHKLIKAWIADGIIPVVRDRGEGGRSVLEDVAESCLYELIERSMVMVGYRNEHSSKIITCRLHDIMKDLCLLRAEREGFLHVINLESQGSNGEVLSYSYACKFRRVAVHVSNNVSNQGNIGSPHLRSLVYFKTIMDRTFNWSLTDDRTGTIFRDDSHLRYIYSRHWDILEPSFKGLKLLRVLDLEGADMKGREFPRDVGKLTHLRFLSIRHGRVSRFPSSLVNLRMLQTLDLRVSISLNGTHVPDVIWKMENLRHLFLPSKCDDATKLQLGNLKNLQTLVNFQVGICCLTDLFNLTYLRRLTGHRIWKSKNSKEIIPASLGHSLKFLESLSLGGSAEYGAFESNFAVAPADVDARTLFSGYDSLAELVLYVGIEKLPDYQQFPLEITSITLGYCKLKEDPMPILEKVPKLKQLDLRWNAFIGGEMVCSRQGFPQLSYLSLFKLENLKEWKMEEGAMSNIHQLHVYSCRQLRRLPKAIRSLTNLQKLTIDVMPEEFKDKLIEGGEDFYIIQHVPSIKIKSR